jgi:aldehyde dehydrogenase (NAD+)
VERGVYDRAVAKAAEVAAGDQGRPRSEPGRHIGPVVNKRQWDQIQGYIQKGIDEGARLVCGGPGLPEGFNRGFYVKPTVFADVPRHDHRARGNLRPGAVDHPLRHRGEAVRIANDTPYGLTNYVQSGMARGEPAGAPAALGHGRDERQVARRRVAFGGVKASGRAREGGIWGIEEFLEVKGISGWDDFTGLTRLLVALRNAVAPVAFAKSAGPLV